MVVWGSNAYIVQADIDMIKQVSKSNAHLSNKGGTKKTGNFLNPKPVDPPAPIGTFRNKNSNFSQI